MFGFAKRQQTRFWEALLEGEVAELRSLLEGEEALVREPAPAKLRRREPELLEDAQPLHIAAGRGLVEVSRLLLHHGADVHATAAGGSTPLHEAAQYGQVDMVELLIQQGAVVGALDDSQRTPLHRAAMAGREEAALRLLDRGAAADAVDADGFTILHALVTGGCEQGVRRVIQSRVEINECTHAKQRTPLHLAVLYADHSAYSRVQPERREVRARMERIAKELLDHGADPNAIDASGDTPLDLFNYLQGDDESDPLVTLLRERGGRWMRYQHRHGSAPAAGGGGPASSAPAQAAGAARPLAGESHHGGGHESHGSTMGGWHAVEKPAAPQPNEPIALGEGPLLIGRHPDCHVRYRSRTLSRRHARITCEHGNYTIRDLGSHNGVQIDNRDIHGPHLLSPGEIITLGIYEFEFDGQHITPLQRELTEDELRAELAR